MPVRVKDILIATDPVQPEMPTESVLQIFLADPSLTAIPVVLDGMALGLVTRAHLTEAMAGPNGREMLGHSPIMNVMLRDVEFTEINTPVALIAKKAADRGTRALSDGLIVLTDGQYTGIVTPMAVLTAVAKENAARARVMKTSNKKLDEARQQAHDMEREKSRFLAMLGHEIRTPLTGILGLADLLTHAKMPEDSRRMARTIGQSGRLLDRLLGDLLDLSRMEAGKLDITPEAFDLNDFSAEARDLWIGRAESSNLTLKMRVAKDAIPRIEADAMRLRQILFNLLSNALKFTEKGSVSVALETPGRGENLALRMTVTDTGCGISDADKARLFEEFEQASITTVRKHGGTGLGLSIAKGLAERMGGSIKLTDNPKGGSIFTVEIPVRKAGPRLAVENVAKPKMANFQLGKILIAEDHAVCQLVIEEALKAAGWQVDCVQTGEQALRRALARPYQAILMDVYLPGMRGDKVLRGIHDAAGINEQTPILAVTADVSPERRAACKRVGFDGFIEKPVRPRRLIASLADAIMHADNGQIVRRVQAV